VNHNNNNNIIINNNNIIIININITLTTTTTTTTNYFDIPAFCTVTVAPCEASAPRSRNAISEADT